MNPGRTLNSTMPQQMQNLSRSWMLKRSFCRNWPLIALEFTERVLISLRCVYPLIVNSGVLSNGNMTVTLPVPTTSLFDNQGEVRISALCIRSSLTHRLTIQRSSRRKWWPVADILGRCNSCSQFKRYCLLRSKSSSPSHVMRMLALLLPVCTLNCRSSLWRSLLTDTSRTTDGIGWRFERSNGIRTAIVGLLSVCALCTKLIFARLGIWYWRWREDLAYSDYSLGNLHEPYFTRSLDDWGYSAFGSRQRHPAFRARRKRFGLQNCLVPSSVFACRELRLIM